MLNISATDSQKAATQFPVADVPGFCGYTMQLLVGQVTQQLLCDLLGLRTTRAKDGFTLGANLEASKCRRRNATLLRVKRARKK